MLVDNFGRKIENLRISITGKCNLNCFYCHNEGKKIESADIMSKEEIMTIINAFYQLGIQKIKITGGEPLLRNDVCEIIHSMPSLRDISMTTNGTLLEKMAPELAEAGLNRINISLDTLDSKKYKKITGGDVKKVIKGINAAYAVGLTPIKVNMVILKGVNENENEIEELLNFTSSLNKEGGPVILQVIELLNLPNVEEYHFDIGSIEKKYAEKAKSVLVRKMHKRRQYAIGDSLIEFVKPLENKDFCKNCNRIRVTADGQVKPCLMKNDNLVNIRGLNGNELKEAIKKAVSYREPFFCR